MELFSHREVCRIVDQFLINFGMWLGYTEEQTKELKDEFIEDNPKVKIRRDIKITEIKPENIINDKDLDDNGTL